MQSYSNRYSSRPTHITSRLARTEQKKVIRQTVLYIGIAILAIGLFVFVIVPNFLKFIANRGANDASFNLTDEIPPQVPVLSAPPDATFSATLSLKGFAENDSQVVILVNGTEASRVAAGTDGTFTAEAALTAGENTISAYSIDTNNNESNPSKTYAVTYDNEPPKLEVSEPVADQQFEQQKNQVITIKGMSAPNARITVNGRLAFAGVDGAFSTTYQLQEGDNLLTIEALDKAGNKARQELTVKYRP